MTRLELLRAVRELLSSPQRWTTQHLARDREGFVCAPGYDRACSWCLLGAFLKLTPGRPPRYLDSWVSCLFPCPIGFFNDSSTHKDIMNTLAARIQEEEEAEKFSLYPKALASLGWKAEPEPLRPFVVPQGMNEGDAWAKLHDEVDKLLQEVRRSAQSV